MLMIMIMNITSKTTAKRETVPSQTSDMGKKAVSVLANEIVAAVKG